MEVAAATFPDQGLGRPTLENNDGMRPGAAQKTDLWENNHTECLVGEFDSRVWTERTGSVQNDRLREIMVRKRALKTFSY